MLVFTQANAQNMHLGTVALLMTDGLKNEDIKYEVIYNYPFGVTIKRVNELIESNRYIIAVINVNNLNSIVVHNLNMNSIKQVCEEVGPWEIKKKIKDKMKQGYSLKYYMNSGFYCIFEHNPTITKQEYHNSSSIEKEIEKLNSKGMSVKALRYPWEYVVQNGFDNACKQKYEAFESEESLIKGIEKYATEGWNVGSLVTNLSFRNYNSSFHTNYHVIFDKSNNLEIKPKEHVVLVETPEELAIKIKEEAKQGFYISNLWGQWDDKKYIKSRAEEAASYKPDWVGILTGITSELSQLNDRNTNNATAANDGTESNNYNIGEGRSNTTGKTNSIKYNHANWSSLEKSYSNYESQLIRISNSSNIDKQEVRSIQKKMKEIREKIYKQSGGHQRAVSQWENWNP